MLKGKKIILGVTGGIAAYKIPFLVRALKGEHAQVRVVMTEAATKFVTPLTLATLSGDEVVAGTFPQDEGGTLRAGTWHISLGTWADAMLIAPATANTTARLAHGLADNAVTTLALSLRCPLIISPAMDTDMLEHPATISNIGILRERGCIVLPPESGELASGLVGSGRLPGIDSIVRAVDRVLSVAQNDFAGRKIVVTAGPTCEPIDPVRFVGNRSSGKMGFAIANAAALRGADVTLITGPVALMSPRNVKRVDVETADEMYRRVVKAAGAADTVIMAAAVADFTPRTYSKTKIKKRQFRTSPMVLELKQTKDILQHLSSLKPRKVLVGFSLETDRELFHAQEKLKAKRLDLIVLNNPLREGAEFGAETNVVTLIPRKGKTEKLPKLSKFDVANRILNRISNNIPKR